MSTLTQAWLDLQCRMLSGIAEALVLPANEGSPRAPDAIWPSGRTPHPRLSLAAQKALASGKEVMESPGEHQIIACPLFIDGRIQAVVSMDVSRRNETQRRALMQGLRWGAFWLELMKLQQEAATGRHMMTLFELIEACLDHERAENAATALVNELATRLHCRRVSLGLLNNKQIEWQETGTNGSSCAVYAPYGADLRGLRIHV